MKNMATRQREQFVLHLVHAYRAVLKWHRSRLVHSRLGARPHYFISATEVRQFPNHRQFTKAKYLPSCGRKSLDVSASHSLTHSGTHWSTATWRAVLVAAEARGWRRNGKTFFFRLARRAAYAMWPRSRARLNKSRSAGESYPQPKKLAYTSSYCGS